MCHEGVEQFEERRIEAAMERRLKKEGWPIGIRTLCLHSMWTPLCCPDWTDITLA